MSQIDLSKLSFEQLTSLRKQMQGEAEGLSVSFDQLAHVLEKYTDAARAVAALRDSGADSEKPEMLVPLTSSVFVKGRSVDRTKVTVDIGTGYYVEKSIADALEFYERKTSMVRKNMQLVQKQLNVTKQNLETVSMVVNRTAAEHRQRAAAAQQKQAS
jgi:prefoldin alpha subunit